MIKDVIWNQLIRWSNFFYSYWESNPYLEAKYVLLCPPSLNDFDGLSSSAPDGEIWSNPYALFASIIEMQQYSQDLVKEQKTIFYPL